MTAELDTLSFEEAFAELQGAVEELRGDALTLDRSLALYERGVALAQRCTALLTDAELRITQSPATRSAPSDGRDRETDW
jgi:exodeoxyribonuclease VII small subunit